jgi:hypothetical protein
MTSVDLNSTAPAVPNAVVAASNPHDQKLSAPPGQNFGAEHPGKPFWYETLHDPVAAFTLALVISTVLLWRATLRLAREARESSVDQSAEMERSIEAANKTAAAAAAHVGVVEDTAKKELRAYVGFPNVRLIDRFGTDPRFEVWIQNYGKTPAIGVVFNSVVGVAPARCPPIAPYLMGTEFGTMEPGRMQSALIGFAPANFQLHAAALNSAQVVQLWGKLTYSDIYGRSYSKEMIAYISHRRIDDPGEGIAASVLVRDEVC